MFHRIKITFDLVQIVALHSIPLLHLRYLLFILGCPPGIGAQTIIRSQRVANSRRIVVGVLRIVN